MVSCPLFMWRGDGSPARQDVFAYGGVSIPQVCGTTSNSQLGVRPFTFQRFSMLNCPFFFFFDRPFKVPLSAFVVGDMMEFVQAHATYRFVILDEEEEKPRLLVCACRFLKRSFSHGHVEAMAVQAEHSFVVHDTHALCVTTYGVCACCKGAIQDCRSLSRSGRFEKVRFPLSFLHFLVHFD
jgi:hypothetical protein